MRHFLFGLIAVVLGFGALAATSAPAQAQGFSITAHWVPRSTVGIAEAGRLPPGLALSHLSAL